MAELTRIMAAIDRGDQSATGELFPIVYDELRRLAARQLRHEAPGNTLQTTALVHEAYLRLVGGPAAETGQESGSAPAAIVSTDGRGGEPGPNWQSRGHFFAAAAEAMRRILVENARRKGRLKRGGHRERIALEQVEPAEAESPVDLLALNEALDKLEAAEKVKADVVKLRYFAGLTIGETAVALSVSTATVKRHWLYARAWLRRAMSREVDES